MQNISAGWETDLFILKLSGSNIHDFDSHLIINSPENPEFHWGNFVLVKDPEAVNDSFRWVDVFQKNFPEASWTAIGLPLHPSSSETWQKLGMKLETLEVLKSDTLPAQPKINENYTSRIFEGEDWIQLLNYEIKSNLTSGEHEPAEFEKFIRNAISVRKSLCDQQKAAWFGAFFDDELVSSLGIIICEEIARYQEVQTNEHHRRRGLASHLLGKASSWANGKGAKSFVIITESTNDAGRVYRKAGFDPDLEIVTAYKVVS